MAATERGPTETRNEIAPEHSSLAHSSFASGLDMLCAYAREFSRVLSSQRRVLNQKVIAAPTTTPAKSQRVLVMAEIRRAMVIVRLRLGLRLRHSLDGQRERQAGLLAQLGPTTYPDCPPLKKAPPAWMVVPRVPKKRSPD